MMDSTPQGPLCNSEFEADLVKAMDLSLAEEEKSNAFANEHDPSISKQQQCPVCDDYFVLSAVEFKQHIDLCLDKDDDVIMTIPTSEQNTSTWRHFFQSIPTTIQGTLVGKGIPATQNLKDSDSTMITGKGQPRQVPDYKWMKDTKFVVDAFSYGNISGCEGYFLTHFHSDHYHGLNQSWIHGPIYCSQITANLVFKRLKVESSMIRILPMDQPIFIHPTLKVTLIDANHCPGSALFIFDIQQPEGTWIRHLHTGDFRANPAMCLHPLLRQPENPTIDHLYLDTTYLDAKYGFPAQEESIQAACQLVKEYISSDLLIVVGSYSIGKEKVFLAIAQLLQSKIFVTSVKKTFLDCLGNKDLENMLTEDQKEAQVHVLPLNDIKAENMHAYLKSLAPRFTKLIAFKPTGWTFQSNDDTSMEIQSLAQVTMPLTDRHLTLTPQHNSDTLKIYGVPYSEHSSFRELASFYASLDIRYVVPTVNCESQKSQDRMMLYLDRWKHDKLDRPSQVVSYPAESHW